MVAVSSVSSHQTPGSRDRGSRRIAIAIAIAIVGPPTGTATPCHRSRLGLERNSRKTWNPPSRGERVIISS